MSVKVKEQALRRVRKPRIRAGEAELNINDVAVRELLARLARVEGQVRAVARMIEERRDCHAIVIQLGAARAALQRATAKLMVNNLMECLRSAKGGSGDAEIQKMTDTFIKLL
jgi:DNA-binding FrmR family transcriptional regulator